MRKLFAAIASSFLSGAAAGHHSYAMFDTQKEVAAPATVRIWQFTSPHAKLWVYITDTKGEPVLWALEAPGPQQLLAAGWDRNTINPGDKISVVLHPLRDGRAGGSLQSVTLADGRKMTVGAAANAGSPPLGIARPGA